MRLSIGGSSVRQTGSSLLVPVINLQSVSLIDEPTAPLPAGSCKGDGQTGRKRDGWSDEESDK